MNKEEANIESLECARYGEEDDLRSLFVSEGADANYADESGTTAMHRAAANGEVGCLKILKEFGSNHAQNLQGNFPIHWAALNAQEAALKFLLENYDIDVLAKNSAGRSTLSEAFQTQKTEIIEICLSHSSASEENLMKTDADTRIAVDGDDDKHAVVHEMDFSNIAATRRNKENIRILKVRELPITRADSPFGSDTAPEDDTTGLGIWPAAVLLSRWIVQQQAIMRGKVVIELGAGCGLPALAAALYCGPSVVYSTDIHDPTLNNAAHNARINVYKPNDDEDCMNIKMTSKIDEKYIEEVVILSAGPEIDPTEASDMDIDRMNINDNTNISTNMSINNTNNTDNANNTNDTNMTNETNETIFRQPSELTETMFRVAKVSWSDPSTFPEKCDVLIGSDLVYDSKILGLLTVAVDGMLAPGGNFLYVAPDECRDGIDGLIGALKGVNVHCILNEPCPEWMYENPLSAQDEENDDMQVDGMDVGDVKKEGGGGKGPTVGRGDNYVLHFYDLAARKPHSLYQFVKQ